MIDEKIYDTAVIGGGLAGLSAAILLAKKGRSVILLEKETYPFHKVCGEYISLESWDFIAAGLGLHLKYMNLPFIKNLKVTSATGKPFSIELPLGGFGISRFLFDNALKDIAVKSGVQFREGCKAEDIHFNNDIFTIKTNSGIIESRTCCGAYGKRSNLDIKLNRPFIQEKGNRLNNYIGIKYHISGPFAENEISLHNFRDGYCGLSKIEENKFCLCYLTKASNLKSSGNSIKKMEQDILFKNAALKNIFESCTMLYEKPVSISQISFSNKKQIEEHMLMAGDAGGMITPLCGNGMSIAMHTGKLAAVHISAYLAGKTNRREMEKNYSSDWNKNFRKRLRAGRVIQYFFGKPVLTNAFLRLMKTNRSFAKKIISLTHGKHF